MLYVIFIFYLHLNSLSFEGRFSVGRTEGSFGRKNGDFLLLGPALVRRIPWLAHKSFALTLKPTWKPVFSPNPPTLPPPPYPME